MWIRKVKCRLTAQTQRAQVQVDDGDDFSPALLSALTTVSQYTIDGRLAAGTYYWRVRPLNDCGVGSWAGPASVEVGPSVYLPLVLR